MISTPCTSMYVRSPVISNPKEEMWLSKIMQELQEISYQIDRWNLLCERTSDQTKWILRRISQLAGFLHDDTFMTENLFEAAKLCFWTWATGRRKSCFVKNQGCVTSQRRRSLPNPLFISVTFCPSISSAPVHCIILLSIAEIFLTIF